MSDIITTLGPFQIDFTFDKIAAAYMLVGAFLMLLIAVYSRAHRHKEKGSKRFINNILCIYTGYNVAAASGNLVTLIAGLILLGVPAVVLFIVYKNRFLLAKNIVGILLINLGVLCLMRSSHLWERHLFERLLPGILGLLLAIAANWIARVQSSANRRIMYVSTAQMGLMFVEVAAGWHILALLHLAGNSFLRAYQLLISPSSVAYLTFEQSCNASPNGNTNGMFSKKLINSIFILTIK